MSIEGFAKVPHSVARDGSLNPYAFRVYAVLAGHIHREPWAITLTDLAAECGFSDKQVRRELPTLAERYGLRWDGGRGKAYRFWWDSQSVQSDSQSVQSDSQSVQSDSQSHSAAGTEAPDRTHSPIQSDSQSHSIGLTVPLLGTVLKEPIEPLTEPEKPRRRSAAAKTPPPSPPASMLTPDEWARLKLAFTDCIAPNGPWTEQDFENKAQRALDWNDNSPPSRRWKASVYRGVYNWLLNDAVKIRERRTQHGEHGGRAEASAASSRQQPGVGGGNRPPSGSQGSRGGPQHPAAGLGFSRRNR